MHYKLFIKLGTIVILSIALLVPLALLMTVVGSREDNLNEAKTEVRGSVSGDQVVTGPLLVVPYELVKTKQREVIEQPAPGAPRPAGVTAAAGQIKLITDTETLRGSFKLVPRKVQISGTVTTKTLWRGIYPVLTYDAALNLKGDFMVDLKERVEDLKNQGELVLGKPFLVLEVGDVRGLRSSPAMVWNGVTHATAPGTKVGAMQQGFHVDLPALSPVKTSTYSFEVPLQLAGMEALHFTPLGRTTEVTLTSSWPHPSFQGRFLPMTREITAQGFKASWRTNWLATALESELAHDRELSIARLHKADFGVQFVRPVNVYLQTSRVLKYAILFVMLTFATFFLFEVMKRLRIHPMQYLLVGLAQAAFYLLLIALSEHVAFGVAYGIGVVACVALLGAYLSAVLGSWRRSVGFNVTMAALYAALYGVLQSEDHALLLGATLVFLILSAVMLLTRKIDWYEVSLTPEASEPA